MAIDSKSMFKQFFKRENEEVVFIGNKLIIQIPEKFIEDGITQINQTTITTLGIFEGLIFDDINEEDITKYNHKFVYKLPATIYMKPSHIDKTTVTVEDIETETVVKENYYNFIFLNGDTFIVSTSLVQSFGVVDNFINMMLNGKLPKNIRYDEISAIWSNCAFINGSGSMGSDFVTLSTIVSNLVRDPLDLSKPFRLSAEEYYKKGVYNGKMLMYRDIPRYISNFTAITGSDPKHSITVAMERIHGEGNKDIISPVEENIM
jgi:hypothetical protein